MNRIHQRFEAVGDQPAGTLYPFRFMGDASTVDSACGEEVCS